MEKIRNQLSPSKPLCQKKREPKRQLGLDDEALLVLMRIRLDSLVEDLAFRFRFLLDIHQSFLQLSQFFQSEN